MYYGIENDYGFTYMTSDDIETLRQVEHIPQESNIFWDSVSESKIMDLLHSSIFDELYSYANS